MLIHIEDIKDEGLSLEFEESPEAFPLLMEVVADGECTFVAPVRTRLRALHVRDMVEVEGTVETVTRLSCSRCLENYNASLIAPFALTYAQQLPEIETEPGEEVEISAEEMGLILLEGEEIDLREAVQEQILMALPLRPLCRDDCKGLCPECGANLNERECGCGKPDFNIKFSALKNFKVKKEKDE